MQNNFWNVLSRLLNKILSLKINCVTRRIPGWNPNIPLLLIFDLEANCQGNLCLHVTKVDSKSSQIYSWILTTIEMNVLIVKQLSRQLWIQTSICAGVYQLVENRNSYELSPLFQTSCTVPKSGMDPKSHVQ